MTMHSLVTVALYVVLLVYMGMRGTALTSASRNRHNLMRAMLLARVVYVLINTFFSSSSMYDSLFFFACVVQELTQLAVLLVVFLLPLQSKQQPQQQPQLRRPRVTRLTLLCLLLEASISVMETRSPIQGACFLCLVASLFAVLRPNPVFFFFMRRDTTFWRRLSLFLFIVIRGQAWMQAASPHSVLHAISAVGLTSALLQLDFTIVAPNATVQKNGKHQEEAVAKRSPRFAGDSSRSSSSSSSSSSFLGDVKDGMRGRASSTEPPSSSAPSGEVSPGTQPHSRSVSREVLPAHTEEEPLIELPPHFELDDSNKNEDEDKEEGKEERRSSEVFPFDVSPEMKKMRLEEANTETATATTPPPRGYAVPRILPLGQRQRSGDSGVEGETARSGNYHLKPQHTLSVRTQSLRGNARSKHSRTKSSSDVELMGDHSLYLKRMQRFRARSPGTAGNSHSSSSTDSSSGLSALQLDGGNNNLSFVRPKTVLRSPVLMHSPARVRKPQTPSVTPPYRSPYGSKFNLGKSKRNSAPKPEFILSPHHVDSLSDSKLLGALESSGKESSASTSPRARTTSTAKSPYAQVINAKDLIKIDVIGRGNTGEVWRALHAPTLSFVVLKTVKLRFENKRKQIYGEFLAFSSNQNRHGSILRYHGAFYYKGEISLIVEYMNRGSLMTIVEQFGVLGEAGIVRVARHLLSALASLHGNNQVHRDIKPSNALVNSNGDVKLTDFGILTQLSEQDDSCSEFCGTIPYMAPERIESPESASEEQASSPEDCGVSECKYGTAADVWSAGLTLLYCLTGELAMPTEYFELLCFFRETDHVVLPDFLTAECKSFLNAMLEFNPNKRKTARDLLDHPFLDSMSDQLLGIPVEPQAVPEVWKRVMATSESDLQDVRTLLSPVMRSSEHGGTSWGGKARPSVSRRKRSSANRPSLLKLPGSSSSDSDDNKSSKLVVTATAEQSPRLPASASVTSSSEARYDELECSLYEDGGGVDLDVLTREEGEGDDSPMASVRSGFLGHTRQSSMASNCSTTSTLNLESGLSLELDLDDPFEVAGDDPTPLALFNVQPTGCSPPPSDPWTPASPVAVALDISTGGRRGDVKVQLANPKRASGEGSDSLLMRSAALRSPQRPARIHRALYSGGPMSRSPRSSPRSPGAPGALERVQYARQRASSAVEVRSPRSPHAIQKLTYGEDHVLVLNEAQIAHIARSLNVDRDAVTSIRDAVAREEENGPSDHSETERKQESKPSLTRNLSDELEEAD